MFQPLSVPYGAKMLFNTVKLKPGVRMEDVELAIGEMCSVVKNTYGGEAGGFLGGQVFKEHERSHADEVFRDRFAALEAMCTESRELGYDMMWQGEPEGAVRTPGR